MDKFGGHALLRRELHGEVGRLDTPPRLVGAWARGGGAEAEAWVGGRGREGQGEREEEEEDTAEEEELEVPHS